MIETIATAVIFVFFFIFILYVIDDYFNYIFETLNEILKEFNSRLYELELEVEMIEKKIMKKGGNKDERNRRRSKKNY